MRQAERENNVGARPGRMAKPTAGDVLLDGSPLPLHQYCPVQLVPSILN